MKVLLVNGGPHPKGCTNRALEEVEKALKEEGIETLIYHIPNVPLQDCIACGSCAKTGKCVFDDCVNEFASKMLMALSMEHLFIMHIQQVKFKALWIVFFTVLNQLLFINQQQ